MSASNYFHFFFIMAIARENQDLLSYLATNSVQLKAAFPFSKVIIQEQKVKLMFFQKDFMWN